ncbi:MAG: hypothetical protein ACM3L6_06425 [Deltaproteobacteria bacterium]
MARDLRLAVGGICFSLTSREGISLPAENPAYLPFVSRKRPDVLLRFQPGRGTRRRQRILFRTPGYWTLSQAQGARSRRLLEVRGRTLTTDPDFVRGRVYVSRGWKRFPFGFPLDELLMINVLGRGRGLLVHACGLKTADGRGLLFLGNSGAGKSTTARLWKDEPGVTFFSDDRLILRRIGGRFWMYGTPWHGDARVYSPQRVALTRIFFLKHASQNSVTRLTGAAAAAHVLKRSFPAFWDKEAMAFSLRFCDTLVRHVPCYEFGFLPDASAVDFIKRFS